MRLPNIEADGWELRSGEAAHAKSPSSFWIPSLEDRKDLRRGLGAKLIFDIECVNDSDKLGVNGERMWYALHGYDIYAMPTSRGMYGHGRVLPPKWRTIDHALDCSRLLLTKAARRMRRDGFYASKLWLWLDMREGGWFGQRELPIVQDDFACLNALNMIWEQAKRELRIKPEIIRVGVTLLDLCPDNQRQLDLFLNDDGMRRKCERITNVIDNLNRKFGRRVVTIGDWTPPPGGYAGGKIAYNRIPSAEDFW